MNIKLYYKLYTWNALIHNEYGMLSNVDYFFSYVLLSHKINGMLSPTAKNIFTFTFIINSRNAPFRRKNARERRRHMHIACASEYIAKGRAATHTSLSSSWKSFFGRFGGGGGSGGGLVLIFGLGVAGVDDLGVVLVDESDESLSLQLLQGKPGQ